MNTTIDTCRALTMDAWWAWAIAHGSKRVENPTWRTNYRGPLLIHAGRSKSRDALAVETIRRIDRLSLATMRQIEAIRGRLVAVAELVDCRSIQEFRSNGNASPWGAGPWCWELAEVRVIADPIIVVGQQSLWRPSPEVADRAMQEATT